MQLAPLAGLVYPRQLTARVVVGLAILAGSAFSQSSSSAFATSGPFPGVASRLSFCDAGTQTPTPGKLTFKQQACWYGNDLASPSMLLHAGFSSALGQWRDDEFGKGTDGTDYAHRFGVFYARHSARDAAELVAGYLNHEDPRPHTSGETGVMRRTKAALMSVLVAKTDEGSRPALTPIAGAFGSALVGSAMSRDRSFSGGTFGREMTFSYTSSFATAVYNEFKPDISSLARRALHKSAY